MGKVVVYPTATGNLAVGLVDFDASCDLRDKTAVQLQAQQQAEYKTIIKSVLQDGTYRRTGMHSFDNRKAVRTVRRAFVSGFITGYETPREGCPEISPLGFLNMRKQLRESINPFFQAFESYLGLECPLKEYNWRLFHALKRNRNRLQRLHQKDKLEEIILRIDQLIKRSIGYGLDELIFDRPSKT